MRVVVKIEGVEDVIASLKRVGEAGEKAMLRVAGATTARVVPQAKAITPVEDADGGSLRDSVRATKPTKTRAGRVSAGVVAGGAPLRRLASERGRALPGQYGSIIHEDLTLRLSNGQHKFVEKPFFAEVPKVPDALEAALDQLTAGEGV
jgi:hypothetical protein